MMGGPESLGLRPRFESGVALPYGVRCVKRMVFGFGPFEKVKLDEARHLVEMCVARQPDMLECGFGPLGDAEPVHGDKHGHLLISCDSRTLGTGLGRSSGKSMQRFDANISARARALRPQTPAEENDPSLGWARAERRPWRRNRCAWNRTLQHPAMWLAGSRRRRRFRSEMPAPRRS